MSRSPLILSFVCLGVVGGQSALAQCETWSPEYGRPGFDSPIRALVEYDDGSGSALYVAGGFTRGPGGAVVASVAKRSGSTWVQVGTPPTVPMFGECGLTVADLGNGPELFLHGNFQTGTLRSVAVYRWDGAQWSQVGPDVIPASTATSPSVDALVAFDDGTGTKLYAGGDFQGCVASFDGTSWSAYAGGLFSETDSWGWTLPSVSGLAVHDDGGGSTLYAVGGFNRCCSPTSPTVLSSNVARIESGAWASVGSGLGDPANHQARGLASFQTPAGRRLAVTGALPAALGKVAIWDGASWTSIYAGPGTPPRVQAFEPGSGVDAGLWISGEFTQVAGVPAPGRARFDGSTWTAIGVTSAGEGRALFATFDDGSGTTAFAASALSMAIVEKLGANAWSAIDPLGLGSGGIVQRLAVAPGPDGAPNLYVSGGFMFIGGVLATNQARFDGEAWHAIESPPGAQAQPVYAQVDLGAGPKLYAMGPFTGYGPPTTRLLRRDGATWTALPNVPAPGTAQNVYELAAFDDGTGTKLFAAGPAALWSFDGVSWSFEFFTSSPGISDLLVHDDGSGPALFVAGWFTSLGGEPFRGIARYDGQTLDSLQGGVLDPTAFTSGASSLAVHDFGAGPELVVGGYFTTAGSVSASGLARWTGSEWIQVGNLVDGRVDQVLSLDLGNGGGNSLFARGFALGSVGQPLIHEVARWDGASWHALDGGVLMSNGNHGIVNSFAAFDTGDGRGPQLFVGGFFETAGGVSSHYLARLESCGGDASTFCYGDGSAAACPCGNASAVGDRAGCLHSLGSGGTLRVHGRASLADDSLVLEGATMPNSSVLYFQGMNVVGGGSGVTFGDGLKCTSGPFIRLGSKSNVAGASAYPSGADLSISVRGAIASIGTRHYQARYRNAASFCTPETFNYTNGVSVTWGN